MDLNQLSQSVKRLADIISKSNFGGIIIPPQPNADVVASTTALYLSLLQKGINLILSCESPINFDLIGADKFQNSLSAPGDNLVISLPYTDGAIDTVDYRIENNRFNLIVVPREKGRKINANEVKFYYTGGNFDFIIVLNSPTLNTLGSLYQNNPQLFQGREIINIDRHFTNANFGTLNIVKKNVSSLAELIYLILKEAGLPIDRDIATNLYAGIASATNQFTSFSTNADTFQAIADLLRQGAVKKIIRSNQKATTRSPISFTAPQQAKFTQPVNIEDQTVKPVNKVEKETETEKTTPPDEWLKPKIFKGRGLI